VNMWEHPATQANLAKLRDRGVTIVEPDAGYLACGMVGAGRLAANEHIVSVTNDVLSGAMRTASGELAGETVLITAGPTREPIDPVRFLGNRSSGKMGFALAEQANRMGANVVLISGPVALADPAGVRVTRVETAEQMREAVLRELPKASIVIKAAAVADYRVKSASAQKIKRKGPITLELEPATDIAAEIGARKKDQVVIGFAAETENVLEHARKKLESKSLDAIVLNDVSKPGIGFDSDSNAVTILTHDQQIEVPQASKAGIAERILKFTAELKRNRQPSIAK
jgi:phosphopantothenoylcysteine decarboxylase/phosphopantothenate--cysteine ligase